MVTIQVNDVPEGILQSKVDTPKRTLRDIQVIVTAFSRVKQHLIIIETNGYLLDNGVWTEIRNRVVSSQTRGGQIQIPGGV